MPIEQERLHASVSPQAGEASAAFLYSAPGAYTLTARAFDASGNLLFSDSRRIFVTPPALLANRVGNVYNGMVGRLASNDVTGALGAFSEPVRESYSATFSALGTAVVSAATQLGRAAVGTLGDKIAEVMLSREGPNGIELFPVLLIRGSDGLWRIEAM